MWLTKSEVTYAVDHLSGKCREKGYEPPPLGDIAILIASANRFPPEAWLQHAPPPFLRTSGNRRYFMGANVPEAVEKAIQQLLEGVLPYFV
jgi:hypothetical protein